ncbi:RecQ family ATP-dependent DNA helicase [Cyclobacterium plantarum]|uniref:ATP-dependent DNA helicase RecQ n=1 Tax=Cyclobacterium plantarum TaxID=2716263 RepID=A0ABX0H5E1_9BACT|nr:ATP-dependent DNA helicase RecQ [Cyclobacterium plantarum]NHE55667.1 RecQ family ATP-dependent DNA helicase [Cyclobacterium plantarum]
MDQLKTLAIATLKKHFGYQDFRPLQEEIVLSAATGLDTLALMPTGGGKSICFQVPALMNPGICLVISPLIALMKDQVDQLRKRGIKAMAIHSGMRKREIDTLLDNCVYGDYKFLYVSPERLKTEIFIERFKKMDVNLIAVDEAHCISQWGYDFRPAYLEIVKIRELAPHVPVIALTASATLAVRKDILEKLHLSNPRVFVQSFARSNLSYVVRWAENKVEQAFSILQKVPGSAIVYLRSRKGTKETAQYLQKLGISATYYHAGLEQNLRNQRQMDWIQGKTRVMVATNAFGMGIDKPDVRVVLHLDLPENLENYYQEAGRAGRDGIKAYAVLIAREQDCLGLTEMAENAYPPEELIKRVYQCLANYYRIAVGSAQMSSFDFDFPDFVDTYALDVKLAYNAIKVLQEEGLLLFSESVFLPSSLHFLVSQTKIYEAQIAYATLDPLIKLLLRLYGGELFVNYIRIQENKIAQLMQISEKEVGKMLLKLEDLGLAAYSGKKDKPQVTFLTPRLDAGSLPLDKKRIALRRTRAREKAAQMIAYVKNNKICRTAVILDYFEEKNDFTCGICDTCIQKKKEKEAEAINKRIGEKILKTLAEGEAFSLEELIQLAGERLSEHTVGLIREMEDEGLIATGENGKIRIK